MNALIPARAALPAGQRGRHIVLLVASGVTLLGVAVGSVTAMDISTPKLAGAVIGAALLPLLLIHLQLGALLFLGILWARVSDVAVAMHGAPSVAVPFGGLLLLTALVHRVLRRERVGLAMFKDLSTVVPYLAIVLLSVGWAAYPERTVNYSVILLKDAAIFWILTDTLRTARVLKPAAHTLVLAAGFLGVISVHQYLTNNFENPYGGFAKTEVLNIVGELDSARLGGPLMGPNEFAVIMAVTVPLGLALLRTRLDLLQRAAVSALLLPITLTVLFTYSRGGVIILGLVVLLSLARHRLRPTHLVVGLAGLAVLILATPTLVWDRLETLVSPFTGSSSSGGLVDHSVELRLGAQLTALEMFYAHPFLGVGAGNYEPLYQEYSRWLGLRAIAAVFQPHNLYLEILSETGIVGLALFGLLVAAPLLQLRRARAGLRGPSPQTHDLREILWGIEIAFVGYLASGLLLHGSYPRYFWLILALVVVAGRAVPTASAVPGWHRQERLTTAAGPALAAPRRSTLAIPAATR